MKTFSFLVLSALGAATAVEGSTNFWLRRHLEREETARELQASGNDAFIGQYEYDTTFNRFGQVHVPSSNLEKHNNIGTSKIIIGNASYATSFVTLIRSGDVVNGVTFGQNFDQNMTPMFAYPTSGGYEMPLETPTNETLVSNNPDFTSFIPAGVNSPTPWAMFVHFESPRPGITYRINVALNSNCELEVDSIEANDWSDWGGLWIPCAGSISNWNTHLGSEEYEPNARLLTLSYDEFMNVVETGSDETAGDMLLFIRYFGYYR